MELFHSCYRENQSAKIPFMELYLGIINLPYHNYRLIDSKRFELHFPA